MGRLEAVAKAVGIEIYRDLGMSMIKQSDAQRMVGALSDEGLVVVGIERFLRTEKGLRPDMSNIADFSDLDRPEDGRRAASRFIASLPDEEDALLDFDVEDCR